MSRSIAPYGLAVACRLLLLVVLCMPAGAELREYSLACRPLPRLVQLERAGSWERVEQQGGAFLLEPGPVHLRLRRFGYRDLEWRGVLGGVLRVPPEPGQVLTMEPVLVRLTLATSPPGASAELAGQPLGLTPGPFTVPLERWPNAQTPVNVKLSRPGYRVHEFTLAPGVERWPASGSHALSPRWPLIMPAYEFVRSYPLTSLVVLGSSLAALFGLVLPARRRARQERDRLTRLASMVVSREDDPWVGKQLGAYFLVERLGRGGMATVYLGVPTRSADRGQARAIKVIDREALGHSQELRFRFLREVKILARLRHPNVVLLEAYGEHDGLLYVAMEWIKGPTLASVIRPGGLPAEEALSYLRPLFEAVSYAHAQGIVHRDLKPDNVLLGEGKQVKVVDFGLARAQEFQTVTLTGSIFGTPAYIPPEQVRGLSQTDPRSDQYSLGVMTFELLTGQLPFQGDDPLELVMQHLQEPPPLLTDLRPDLSPRAAQVVARMLAKQPEDRYPDLKSCLRALEASL